MKNEEGKIKFTDAMLSELVSGRALLFKLQKRFLGFAKASKNRDVLYAMLINTIDKERKTHNDLNDRIVADPVNDDQLLISLSLNSSVNDHLDEFESMLETLYVCVDNDEDFENGCSEYLQNLTQEAEFERTIERMKEDPSEEN